MIQMKEKTTTKNESIHSHTLHPQTLSWTNITVQSNQSGASNLLKLIGKKKNAESNPIKYIVNNGK